MIRKFLARALICCAVFGLVGQAEAAPRWLKLSITQGSGNVFVLVKVRRGALSNLKARLQSVSAMVWVRKQRGWKQVRSQTLQRKRWTDSVSLRRLCRGASGKTRMALQVGLQAGKWWWNRWSKQWQKSYVILHQQIIELPCPVSLSDLPPGTPVIGGRPGPVVKPRLPRFSGMPSVPAPGVRPAPRVPRRPPPPPLVSASTFRSFYRSLKAARFSSRRTSTLNTWLAGLGNRLLRPGQVVKIVAAFTYSSNKVKAARRCARHVKRPLRAQQIARIVKLFSHSSDKLKAAKAYCRFIEDRANLHVLIDLFTFSSSKRKLRRACR